MEPNFSYIKEDLNIVSPVVHTLMEIEFGIMNLYLNDPPRLLHRLKPPLMRFNVALKTSSLEIKLCTKCHKNFQEKFRSAQRSTVFCVQAGKRHCNRRKSSIQSYLRAISTIFFNKNQKIQLSFRNLIVGH